MKLGTTPNAGTVADAPPWRTVAMFAAAVLAVVAAASADAPAHRLWMLLVLAPLAEEALFRAGLQEALLRRWHAPRSANLVTALVFGIAHALVRSDPAALVVVVPALLIGALYGRTRRLRDCVALHAAMNAIWLML